MSNPKPIPAIDENTFFRFHASYTNSPDGCSRWTGRISTNGYGRIRIDAREYPAHRVAYFLNYGSIDDALVIDHLCRNRECVNPDHLELVTQQVNVQRGDVFKGADTHCAYGHEYTDENVLHSKSGRRCRECHQRYHREYQRSIQGHRIRKGHRPSSPKGVIPHGTVSGYTYHKCRCAPCGSAKVAHNREYRANRKLRQAA